MTSFTIKLPCKGEPHPYFPRFSPKAKRLTIRVSAEGKVELVIPRRCSPDEAHDFISRQASWIEKTLIRIRAKNARHSGHVKNSFNVLPHEIELKCISARYRVDYEWRDVCWVAARSGEEESRLIITGSLLHISETHRAMLNWLRTKAENTLPGILEATARETGFSYSNLTIRLQKRRWGSCARDGSISLNALLMFLPPDVVRYIIIHELCHLREMNHSPRFWEHVRNLCPKSDILKKELTAETHRIPPYFWSPGKCEE